MSRFSSQIKMHSAFSAQHSALFLLGFMASGKSTVGPILAASLNRRFIDLDRLIEAQVGCTIGELILREGEELFRKLEAEKLREVSTGEPLVIAPGGGAITRAENWELMAQAGITIWLDAPFELCWERIRKDGIVRPLAPDESAARDRYFNRLLLYRRSAIRIAIDEFQTPDQIAELIGRRLNHRED